MTVELAEVRDFLARHAPFDALPPTVLDRVPRSCTLRYARRGTVVVDVGVHGDGLYVVRSGAVDIVDEAGGLIERVGTGGAFGMSSLLEHRPTRYRSTAVEDTLLVVLPADRFEELARDHAAFASFYAGTHHARLSRAIRNLQQATSGHTVLSTPVRSLLTRRPVTTGRSTPVTEAARAMTEMVTRRIHHFPVVDQRGVPLGLATTTDLIRLENSNPVYLAADIGRQTTAAGVVEQAGRIPVVLGELVDRDVSAADVGRVLTLRDLSPAHRR